MKHLLASFTAAIVTLVIAILLCAPLYGQYTMTPTFSLADNTPYCHGTSYSCLTSIGGVMTEIKAGVDGTIYGLNSSHVLYTYTHVNTASVPITAASETGTSATVTLPAFPTIRVTIGQFVNVTGMTPSGYNCASCPITGVTTNFGGQATSITYAANSSGLGAGSYGRVYGIASAWVQAAANLQKPGGLSIVHISVGSQSQVMALSSAASPTSNVYVLDAAGTGWTALSAWLSPNAAEIGSDGTVWGMNSGGTGWAYINGTWAAGGGALANITVASASNAWGVTSGGTLELWNGTQFAALSPTPPFSPSHAKNAIAVVGETSLAVLDTAGTIHISTDAGNTWSTIAGTASAITGAGASMFVLNSSGVSYHVNLLALAVTITYAGGTTVCPGCPPGGGSAFHTLQATSYFGGAGGAHGTAGVTTQASTPVGSPGNFVTTSSTEIGSQCDTFYGLPTDPNCNAFYSFLANCSIGGVLFSGGPATLLADLLSLRYGIATTGAIWNGGWSPIGTSGRKVLCTTDTYCTATTTPPLCSAENVQAIGTSGVVCNLHTPWLEEIPFLTLPGALGGGSVCFWGPNNSAVSLVGSTQGTGPVPCTTATSP